MMSDLESFLVDMQFFLCTSLHKVSSVTDMLSYVGSDLVTHIQSYFGTYIQAYLTNDMLSYLNNIGSTTALTFSHTLAPTCCST